MELTVQQKRVHVRKEVGRNVQCLTGGHFVSTRGHLRGKPRNNVRSVSSIRNNCLGIRRIVGGAGWRCGVVAKVLSFPL